MISFRLKKRIFSHNNFKIKTKYFYLKNKLLTKYLKKILFQSLEEGQPLQLNVTSMDKSIHTIQAHPCMTSRDVVDDVMQRLQIVEKFGFSLFISMDNQVNENDWDKSASQLLA